MAILKKLSVGVLLIAFLAATLALFTVPETDRVLMLRLGRLETNADNTAKVYDPGLHFKVPFVTRLVYLDTRIQTLVIPTQRVVTSEKKDVLVSYYIKWKITDYETYYLRTRGDKFRTESLLSPIAINSLRAQFGQNTIQEAVSGERNVIMETLQKDIANEAAKLGIQVVDVRVKQIDLPDEVSDSVFARMRAEREQVATGHRAQGQREAEKIRADADARQVIILAEAERSARELMGEGEAEATAIYTQAYSQDPEFFSFSRSLEAYRNSFKSGDSMMVLSPENEYFQYFSPSSE